MISKMVLSHYVTFNICVTRGLRVTRLACWSSQLQAARARVWWLVLPTLLDTSYSWTIYLLYLHPLLVAGDQGLQDLGEHPVLPVVQRARPHVEAEQVLQGAGAGRARAAWAGTRR